jgi:hypothetical protein
VKAIAAGLFVLAVNAGCVTTSATPPDVGSFQGRPSQPIFAKLGQPDSTETAGAGMVYHWRTAVVQENMPVRTMTTDYSSGLPVQVEKTTFQSQRQACTLVLAVDAAGTVTGFSRDGSRQACAALLDRLGSP